MSDTQATSSQPFVPAQVPQEQPTFRVYRPPQSAPDVRQSAGIPDSYFTLTATDLKAAQASLHARTEALSNAPLRTQAYRDELQKAREAKYPTATIRVRFPDRTQLEKTFHSGDKIRSVYAFVRSSLRENVKPIKFVLYQTPPKRELKVSDLKVRDQSLLQLQLAPTAILHLKFEDESLNHINVPAPLDRLILAVAEDLPRPPSYEEQSAASAVAGPSKARSSTGPSSQGPVKVPKWLKLGPKK
ncbi:hypothetical protein BDY19DRAFT_973857 [Irpex rosettiformis]|uniref:Uncharacterized protein n=1 Tax=Irpex rosettiformis TaxID=378272 RepID=A0ACB8TQ46_9APHY|nr:hypothetical protein BDY19DRAFT_973857 [Irpex rosettiformis]